MTKIPVVISAGLGLSLVVWLAAIAGVAAADDAVGIVAEYRPAIGPFQVPPRTVKSRYPCVSARW